VTLEKATFITTMASANSGYCLPIPLLLTVPTALLDLPEPQVLVPLDLKAPQVPLDLKALQE
jgi:hypothetical protein